MKCGGTTFTWRRGLISAVVIVVCGLFAPAHCHAQEVVLLLNQTPARAGKITPVAGVHHFKPGSKVTLTAKPKPGYQFAHWLGDVSDSTATSTVVHLNKPKVVVAVFEQAKFGGGDILSGGGGGGGGLMPTATNFYPQSGISAGGGGGGVKPSGPAIQVNKKTPEVPEPATGVLLVMGGLFAFARRRTRRRV